MSFLTGKYFAFITYLCHKCLITTFKGSSVWKMHVYWAIHWYQGFLLPDIGYQPKTALGHALAQTSAFHRGRNKLPSSLPTFLKMCHKSLNHCFFKMQWDYSGHTTITLCLPTLKETSCCSFEVSSNYSPVIKTFYFFIFPYLKHGSQDRQ